MRTTPTPKNDCANDQKLCQIHSASSLAGRTEPFRGPRAASARVPPLLVSFQSISPKPDMSPGPRSSETLYFTDRGTGPVLLLVHGLMVTGEMFETVVDQFATRHRVIVPDLRGHGRSRGLPPPYTVRQVAADVSHLLDHLEIESTAVLG